MRHRVFNVFGSMFVIVFCTLAVASDNAPINADNPPTHFSPREIHKELAEAKARSVERTRELATKATLIDQSNFDATYYDLYIGIYESTEQIIGQVSMRGRAVEAPVNQVQLNLYSNMTVFEVTTFGHDVLLYSHADDVLTIPLDSTYQPGEEFEVTVLYGGHPIEGGFQGFAFDTHNGSQPIISTLSEPYLAQTWWPCKDLPDDKADSVDIRVRARSDLYVSSNGVRRDSTDNGDGTTTYSYHVSYPITTYLVSLAVANYSVFSNYYVYNGGADSMEVIYHSFPERLTSAQTYWPETTQMITCFAELFGEYPFINEKYGMSHFTWGGAMEHQTNTSATSGSFGFDRFLIAHELAHQWWGDLITCKDWHHIWLNEGFASYCEAIYEEWRTGSTAALHSYMNSQEYYSGGRIYVEDVSSVGNIFNSRVYDKGSWVLHMLRHVVGDSTFFAGLRAYYSDPNLAFGNADTYDFRDVMEDVSGRDLTGFFNDWIWGEYYPRHAVSYVSVADGGGGYDTYLHLRQTQTTLPQVFDMPIDVRLVGPGFDTIVVVDMITRETDLHVQTPVQITSVVLDPDDWVLGTNSYETYPLTIVTEGLPQGEEYLPYASSVIAYGWQSSVHFEVTAGQLPPGLSLDMVSGAITGVPSDAGTFDFTVTATDQLSQEDDADLSITIAETPLKAGDANEDGVVNILDVIALIDYVFRSAVPPPPYNLREADVNNDCNVEVLDVVALIDYVFRSGPAPVLSTCTF